MRRPVDFLFEEPAAPGRPSTLRESSVFPRAKAVIKSHIAAKNFTKAAELLYSWSRSGTIWEEEFVELFNMIRTAS